MERIKKIVDFAHKALGIVEKLSSREVREHPAFKVVADFIPCARTIVEVGSWWSAYLEKRAIPKKAIELICHEVGIADSECQEIQSQEQLEALLKERGEENPESVFQRTVNRLFSEAKYPELTRFLVDQQATVLSELEQQFKALKVALQEGFHYLLPLESVLEALPVADRIREPRFFRRIGPLAVDFDAGRVYRRPEMDQVKEGLAKERILLIMGSAASGKSVVARQVAYEFWREGRPVYLLSLTQGIHRAAVQGELERLGDGEKLLVIEDVHLAPKEINYLIEFAQPEWPTLLLTSRPIDFKSVFYKESTRLEELAQVKIQPFDTAQAVVRLFCDEHGIDITPELMQAVTKTSQDNLWLLAYALEALKNSEWEAVDQEFILKQVERDLHKIWEDNDRNDLYPKLLVALSVLYRFEIPTDWRFLEDEFLGARRVLADLTDLGEVLQKGSLFYGLPHSALAALYYELKTRNEWEDPLYSDVGSFIRRYMLSDHAGNALGVFKTGYWNALIQAMQIDDMATLARRIEATDNPVGAIDVIKAMQKANPAVGKALTRILHKSSNNDSILDRLGESIKD